MMRECEDRFDAFPKICNAIMGGDARSILEEVKIIAELSGDILEWRADFFQHQGDPRQVQQVLREIKRASKRRKIIFSLRSVSQGGGCRLSEEEKRAVFHSVLDCSCADYIELEQDPFLPWKEEVLGRAKESGHQVIIAAYDYEKTPEAGEITALMRRCETTGADIPKIAVMTHGRRDILSLLQGILNLEQEYGERERIVVAMGREGNISRMAPWLFGSSFTFASGITTSLQGQINPNDLTLIMSQLRMSR